MSDLKEDILDKEESKSQIDDFELQVTRIAGNIKNPIDDPTPIIQYFKTNKIRSTYFSVNGFANPSVDKCKSQIPSIPQGRLITLFKALHSNYQIQGQCRRINDEQYHEIFKSKSPLVFIPNTQDIVDSELIDPSELQTEDTNKRLYQLLKWTIRLNQNDQNIHCYKSENGILFLVINSELHDRKGNTLYMLCIRNDMISKTIQKWLLAKLMTGTEIKQLICGEVNSVGHILPKGLRNQFEQPSITTKDILIRDPRDYSQLKMVRTTSDKTNKKGTLSLTLSKFVRFICIDLAKSNLIPIISIISGKRYKAQDGTYSIDLLLPVKVKDEWVGICYRYKEDHQGTKHWCPFQVLFDQYDIINKAILYNPKFDARKLSNFQNNICKIEIILEHQTHESMVCNNKPQRPSTQNNGSTEDADSGFQFPPYFEDSPVDAINDNGSSQKVYDYSKTAIQNENKQSLLNQEGGSATNAIESASKKPTKRSKDSVTTNSSVVNDQTNTNSIGYNNPGLRQDGTTNGNPVNYQTSSAACFPNNAPNSGNPEIGQHQFLLTNQTSQITTLHTNNQPLLKYTLLQVQQQNGNNTTNQPQAAQGFNALNGQQIAMTTTGQQANQIQVQQTQGGQVHVQSAALTTQPSLLNNQAIQLQYLQHIQAAQVLQQKQTVLQNLSAQIAQNFQYHTLQYQQAQAQGNQNAMYLATLIMQNDQNLQQQTTAQLYTTVQQLLMCKQTVIQYQNQYNVLQAQNGNNHAQNQNNNTQQTKGEQHNNNNGQQQQNGGNNTK